MSLSLNDNDYDHSFSRLPLSGRIALQGAWVLAHSLTGELLAPCRNKWSMKTVVVVIVIVIVVVSDAVIQREVYVDYIGAFDCASVCRVTWELLLFLLFLLLFQTRVQQCVRSHL